MKKPLKTSNERLKNFLNNELLKTFHPKDWELISMFIICENEKDSNIRGRSKQGGNSR